MTDDILKRAKDYLAHNAAESGADVLISDLIDEVESLRQPWRDLDEAPKDGKKFLALTADFEHGTRFNERVQEAKWSGKTPTDRIGHFQSHNGQMVLYWMPIPASR